MPNEDRNTFTDGDWVLHKVTDQKLCDLFDCDDTDLNEYFQNDAILHREALLGQCYYLYDKSDPQFVLALLDFSNDAVRVEKYEKAFEKHKDLVPIRGSKRHASIPAVKLTRIGVHKEYQRQGIGTHILNMIKRFFTTENRTGCRFITVDAYNNPEVIRFYEKNEFKLFSEKDKTHQTRAMFFDLIRFRYN
jgi:GNAT superfamily N-acetyltransferase